MHGRGTYKHPNGSVYIGDWKDDKPHGRGIETCHNEYTYTGEYIKGQKHGLGKMEWINGNYY
jgi:hypothetical protein